MKFNIYRRFQIEIQREGELWIAYRYGEGKRVKASDIVIPSEVVESELAVFLDDLFHEYGVRGSTIERIV